MEKIALFVCDIMGTFAYEGRDKEEQERELKNLVKNLEQIIEDSGADKMIFSLATYDRSPEYLFRFVNQLKPFLEGTNILLGKQYMSSGSYTPEGERIKSFRLDKNEQMISEVHFINATDEVVWVGYADDYASPHTYERFEREHPTTELSLFSPGSRSYNADKRISSAEETGLVGLNKSFDHHFYKRNLRSEREESSTDQKLYAKRLKEINGRNMSPTYHSKKSEDE